MFCKSGTRSHSAEYVVHTVNSNFLQESGNMHNVGTTQLKLEMYGINSSLCTAHSTYTP